MQLFSSSSVRHIKSTSPNQISSKLDEFYGSYGHFRLSLRKNVQKKWELCKKIWAPIFFLISRVQWTNPEIFRVVWKNSLFLPLELGLHIHTYCIIWRVPQFLVYKLQSTCKWKHIYVVPWTQFYIYIVHVRV